MIEPTVRRWPTLEPLAAPAIPRHRYAFPRPSLAHFPGERIARAERWTIPDLLASSPAPWAQVLRDLYDDPITFPAALSPQAGLLLHALSTNARPRVVVEVGTFLGVSTIWMAAAIAPIAHLHSFDDFTPIRRGPWREAELASGRLERVVSTIARAGLGERVTLHEGNSSFSIRGFASELRAAGGVDLAFLDGDHGRYGLLQDLWSVEPVLNTGGYLVLHDIYPEFCDDDGPRHLLDHVHAHAQGLYEACEIYLSPYNFGLGVLRRIG